MFASDITLMDKRTLNARSMRMTNSVRPRLSMPRSRSSLLDNDISRREVLGPRDSRAKSFSTPMTHAPVMCRCSLPVLLPPKFIKLL